MGLPYNNNNIKEWKRKEGGGKIERENVRGIGKDSFPSVHSTRQPPAPTPNPQPNIPNNNNNPIPPFAQAGGTKEGNRAKRKWREKWKDDKGGQENDMTKDWEWANGKG